VHYTDISCFGGVFAKNTSWETKNFPAERRKKFSLKTGIFRKYPSQTWYIVYLFNYTEYYLEHWLNKDMFQRGFIDHKTAERKTRQFKIFYHMIFLVKSWSSVFSYLSWHIGSLWSLVLEVRGILNTIKR
jgi:hypothetical protein